MTQTQFVIIGNKAINLANVNYAEFEAAGNGVSGHYFPARLQLFDDGESAFSLEGADAERVWRHIQGRGIVLNTERPPRPPESGDEHMAEYRQAQQQHADWPRPEYGPEDRANGRDATRNGGHDGMEWSQ